MKAYDIATKLNVSKRKDLSPEERVKEFIQFVKETKDPDIKGLFWMTVKELEKRREGDPQYLGGDSTNPLECIADSEAFLARVLRDKSSAWGVSKIYVRAQLQNIAWSIGEHKDPFADWIKAQQRYVDDAFGYLENLASQGTE